MPTLCAALFASDSGPNNVVLLIVIVWSGPSFLVARPECYGTKAGFFWPMTASCVGGGNVLPSYGVNIDDGLSGRHFPSIVPTRLAVAADAINSSVNKQLRVEHPTWSIFLHANLVGKSKPSTAYWCGRVQATGNPVSGLVAITTDCEGRNWYSTDAFMFAWIELRPV